MTGRFCVSVFVLIVYAGVAGLDGVCVASAQRGGEGTGAAELFGTWTGTWEGAGTGGFEVTLAKGKDGAPSGGVSVTGEPTYKATFRTLSTDGKKMTAAYDFPPDESLEVVLTATFEGKTANGTWSARQKAGGAEVATGTWTVSRK